MDLLSICIPTYNKKNQLNSLLEYLIKQDISNIKIIVIDNASTDGTDIMMKEFTTNSQIIYKRNKRNFGFDGNVLRLIEEGKKYSKYSLWLGDDDAPTKDFFIDIIKLLKTNNPDIVMLNFFISNSSEQMTYLEQDYVENDFAKFTEKLFVYPFGTWIVKNDILVCDNANVFMNTIHMQIGIVCESMFYKFKQCGNIKAYVTAKPYIMWGNQKTTFSDEVLLGYGNMLALLPEEIINLSNLSILKIFITDTARFKYLRFGYIWVFKKWKGYTDIIKKRGKNIDEYLPTLDELLFKHEILKEYENGFAIWGCGDYGFRCIDLLVSANDKIKCFIDNDPKKQGDRINGIPIFSWDDFNALSNKPKIIVSIMPGKGGYDICKFLESQNLKYNEDFIMLNDFYSELAEKVVKLIKINL